jgi:hypothetical protein
MNKQAREWQKTRRRIRWFVGGHVAAVCFIYAASLWVSERWLAQRQVGTPVAHASSPAKRSADVNPPAPPPTAMAQQRPARDTLFQSTDLAAPWTEDSSGQIRWTTP